MRQLIILTATFFTLIACNNSDTNKTSITTQNVQSTDTTKSSRRILIEELKKVQQAIISYDKEKIADIFQFPLSDTAFSPYIDDSAYNEQFKANGDRTTKEMFVQHFKKISNRIWIDELNNFLKNIQVDSLLHTDILEYKMYIKSKPCYHSYKLEIIKDSIVLRMDIKSNNNYESKKSLEDDIPENSSEFCEHSFWWNFKFDGKKLIFKNIAGAD